MSSQRHPNSERFHQILKELGDLHDKKQLDYGRGNDPFANVRASLDWGVPAWVGAMIRLNDKVKRLQSFSIKGSLANEGVEDSLRDISVYAAIALVLYEEESKKANHEDLCHWLASKSSNSKIANTLTSEGFEVFADID